MTRQLLLGAATMSLLLSVGVADDTIPNGEDLNGRFGGLVYQGEATDLVFYDTFRICSDRVSASPEVLSEAEAREIFTECMEELGYERVADTD